MFGAWSCACAGDIYVIVHPGVRLSAASIRDVYIGEKKFSGAIRIIPIDNTSAQADFLQKVLKLDRAHYTNLWLKKSFRDALNPPIIKNTDDEIVELVRRTPGAIAYVSGKPPPGVNVVRRY
jgi:hypothetical protein